MALRDTTVRCKRRLSSIRIGADGKLTFVRKYDVDTGKFMQFWTGIVTLA